MSEQRARPAPDTARRRWSVAIAAIFVLALLGAVAWLVPRLLDGDAARRKLEAVLTEVLGRDVHIGTLDVDAQRGAVDLGDVTIDNPPRLSGDPLAHAEAVHIDIALEQLLERELVGDIRVQGLDLRIVRFSGTTNLDGLLPHRGGGGDGPKADVHLDLAIEGSTIVLEDLDRGESLVLDGVSLNLVATNRGGAKAVDVHLEVDAVDLHGLPVRDLALDGHGTGEGFEVTALDGRIGTSGRLTGHGRLQLQGGRGWSFDLRAQDVTLDEELTPLLQRVLPLLVAATSTDDAPVRGRLDAEVSLHGEGLRWDTVRRSLQGDANLTLHEVVVPPDAVVTQVAQLAGREPGPWTLQRGFVSISVDDAWVQLSRVEAEDGAVRVPVRGRVSFGGELDLVVDLMPLVEMFGGAAYARVARHVTSIPVRIGGTVDDPDLQPPTPRDVATSVAGGLLRKALGE